MAKYSQRILARHRRVLQSRTLGMSIKDIMKKEGVSRETVQRDLRYLRSSGQLQDFKNPDAEEMAQSPIPASWWSEIKSTLKVVAPLVFLEGGLITALSNLAGRHVNITAIILIAQQALSRIWKVLEPTLRNNETGLLDMSKLTPFLGVVLPLALPLVIFVVIIMIGRGLKNVFLPFLEKIFDKFMKAWGVVSDVAQEIKEQVLEPIVEIVDDKIVEPVQGIIENIVDAFDNDDDMSLNEQVAREVGLTVNNEAVKNAISEAQVELFGTNAQNYIEHAETVLKKWWLDKGNNPRDITLSGNVLSNKIYIDMFMFERAVEIILEARQRAIEEQLNNPVVGVDDDRLQKEAGLQSVTPQDPFVTTPNIDRLAKEEGLSLVNESPSIALHAEAEQNVPTSPEPMPDQTVALPTTATPVKEPLPPRVAEAEEIAEVPKPTSNETIEETLTRIYETPTVEESLEPPPKRTLSDKLRI